MATVREEFRANSVQRKLVIQLLFPGAKLYCWSNTGAGGGVGGGGVSIQGSLLITVSDFILYLNQRFLSQCLV